MGYLSDEKLATDLDGLLSVSSPYINQIISRLQELGWSPTGDIPTLAFSQSLYIYNYNKIREDDSVVIEDAIQLALGQTLRHPLITNFLASKGVQGINHATGVK